MLVIIALLPTQKIVFFYLFISAFEVTDCDFW